MNNWSIIVDMVEMEWSKKMYWTRKLHCRVDPNVFALTVIDIDQARYTGIVVEVGACEFVVTEWKW